MVLNVHKIQYWENYEYYILLKFEIQKDIVRFDFNLRKK